MRYCTIRRIGFTPNTTSRSNRLWERPALRVGRGRESNLSQSERDRESERGRKREGERKEEGGRGREEGRGRESERGRKRKSERGRWVRERGCRGRVWMREWRRRVREREGGRG